MLTVRDSIHIAAAPEAVFGFLDEPARQPSFTPHLKESRLIERLENGGSRVHYTYSMLGVHFAGEVRATDYQPPERIVWAMSGDLQGTLRWYVDREGAGARLTYAATYAVPGPSVLRPLATPVVQWLNEREVAQLLQNVKRQIEEG
jgi:carbon monoxide dehydrogenase subunit G